MHCRGRSIIVRGCNLGLVFWATQTSWCTPPHAIDLAIGWNRVTFFFWGVGHQCALTSSPCCLLLTWAKRGMKCKYHLRVSCAICTTALLAFFFARCKQLCSIIEIEWSSGSDEHNTHYARMMCVIHATEKIFWWNSYSSAFCLRQNAISILPREYPLFPLMVSGWILAKSNWISTTIVGSSSCGYDVWLMMSFLSFCRVPSKASELPALAKIWDHRDQKS